MPVNLFGLCANIDDMNKVRPPGRDCSDKQLQEVAALYDQMAAELHRLQLGPGEPSESQSRKILQFEKKIIPVENEMKRRGISKVANSQIH